MPTSGRFRRIFVAAHAIPCVCQVKYLEGMADDVIPGLEMPSGTPLMYEVDADLKANPNEFSSRLMAIPSAPS